MQSFLHMLISLVQVIDFFYHVNLMKVKVKNLQKLKDVMQMKLLQIINVLS